MKPHKVPKTFDRSPSLGSAPQTTSTVIRFTISRNSSVNGYWKFAGFWSNADDDSPALKRAAAALA
jgi:hypothetical protein